MDSSLLGSEDNVAVSFLWQHCYSQTVSHYFHGHCNPLLTPMCPSKLETVDFQGRHLSRMSLYLSVCPMSAFLTVNTGWLSKLRCIFLLPYTVNGEIKVHSIRIHHYNVWFSLHVRKSLVHTVLHDGRWCIDRVNGRRWGISPLSSFYLATLGIHWLHKLFTILLIVKQYACGIWWLVKLTKVLIWFCDLLLFVTVLPIPKYPSLYCSLIGFCDLLGFCD